MTRAIGAYGDIQMNIQSIQEIFKSNWVFWLFTQKRWSVWIIISLIVFLPVVIFGIIAAVLGEFRLYAGNPLSYSGPIWVGLALIAYNWFTQAFPRTLIEFSPAMDASEEVIVFTIRKWANQVANRLSIMILATLPLSIAAIQDTVTLWTKPTSEWMGTLWVTQSVHPLFFAIVWSFYYGLSVSFMLGSGVVGITGCALLINDLLKLPLKLEYHRRLQSVLDLSTGIGVWTFVSFAITVIGQAFIKPNSTENLLTSSLFLSILASIALLIAFLSPLIPAHNAIIRAKQKKLELYEKRLYEISNEIDHLVSTKKSKVLEALQKDRQLIKQQIKEIEDIPEWPITVLSISKIISASVVMPFINGIPDYVKGNISEYLKSLLGK